MMMHLVANGALMATLMAAAWMDHTSRRIPHRTWIPLMLISALPLAAIWRGLDWHVWVITALLCAGMYLMPIVSAGNPAFTVHGADAIAAILITLVKPLTIGYPTPVFLVLIAGTIVLSAPCIPQIQKSWKERGIPFLVPLTLAAGVIMGLPA